MPNVSIHTDFFQSAGKIPREIYKNIPHFLSTLSSDPRSPGLNLHSLKETAIDPRVHTARLNQAYRVVLLIEDDSILVLHVDHHDDAINWGRNKRFSLNSRDGIQIFDDSIEEVGTDTNNHTYTGLFDMYSDDALFTAGVNHDDLPSIRRIKTKEELVNVCRFLDPLTASVLNYLSDGVHINEAIQKSFEEIVPETKSLEKSKDSLNNLADTNPGTVVRFTRDIEWEKVFSDDFENWRVFLHPAQRKIVNKSLSGALLVYGSAGTGKTVVLLHRAMKILESNPSANILFMTFSSNLGLEIRGLLSKLIGKLAQNIQIYSIYDLAKKICNEANWEGTIITPREIGFKNCWEEALQKCPSLALNSEELLSEYLEIKELNGLYQRDEYYNLTRKGKTRLHRAEREKIWNFFELFESNLTNSGYKTAELILHNARIIVEGNKKYRYDHVLVDEVQDMTTEALRFLRILSGISENQANGLTLAGDTKQRIYRNQVSLSKSGISVVGRSYRLKINYRTSEEIRKFATSLLSDLEIDELQDDKSDTRGDYSAFRGPEPEITNLSTLSLAFDKLKNTLDNLIAKGIKQNEICITYKEDIHVDFVQQLGKKGIPIYELLYNRTDDPSYPGFRVGSVRRIKGIEFKHIIIFIHKTPPILPNLKTLSLYEDVNSMSQAQEREKDCTLLVRLLQWERYFSSLKGL